MTSQTIAHRLAACLSFNEGVTATTEDIDGVAYVLTRGTGEGCDFAYEADDVETWLDARDDAEAGYSEDFANEVDCVDDAALALALLAMGYRIGRSGTCKDALDGAKVRVKADSVDDEGDVKGWTVVGRVIAVDAGSKTVCVEWDRDGGGYDHHADDVCLA